MKKIILFGDSAFAQIAYEYFTHDSNYKVVAFTVSKSFITQESMFGIPIFPFEKIEKYFSPEDHEMHICLVYNKLNRNRIKFYHEAKAKGYKLANYISKNAFVWKNVKMGDNVFIFENNVIQPFVEIGNNNVFWSGNHIGHHSLIGNNNFFSSHCVVSGFCKIGNSSFFGVNCTLNDGIVMGDENVIASGALIVNNVESGKILKGSPAKVDVKSSYELFNI